MVREGTSGTCITNNAFTAKNLILAGVKSVTIHDTESVSIRDLGANFYLTPNDVGSNRAEAVTAKLAELNGAVAVQSHTAPLDRDLISTFSVVVLCHGQSLMERIQISNLCHELGIAIILAETCGLAGMLFVDFGSNFEIRDKDGEPPQSCMIACIDQVSFTLGVRSIHWCFALRNRIL